MIPPVADAAPDGRAAAVPPKQPSLDDLVRAAALVDDLAVAAGALP